MKKKSLIAILVIILIIVIGYLIYLDKYHFDSNLVEKITGNKEGYSKVLIQGDSMSGLLEDGQSYTFNFEYDKSSIQRDDIVIYDYKGLRNAVAKSVKGIEGDKFELIRDGNHYLMYVNDEVVTNSFGEAIKVSNENYRLLHLYESDYKNVIPKDALLLLGNKDYGTIDSTKFGLVSKNDILGVYVR